jgi:hypothetical protein
LLAIHYGWEPIYLPVVFAFVCKDILGRCGVSEPLVIDPGETLLDKLVDASLVAVFLREHGLPLSELGESDPALVALGHFEDLQVVLGELDGHGADHALAPGVKDLEVTSQLMQGVHCLPQVFSIGRGYVDTGTARLLGPWSHGSSRGAGGTRILLGNLRSSS